MIRQYFAKKLRTFWFDDEDGLGTSKTEDEKFRWQYDWTNDLGSTETVASAAYASSGVTLAGTTLVGNITSTNVSGLGEFTVTITSSLGGILEKTFRFYAPNGEHPTDYQ